MAEVIKGCGVDIIEIDRIARAMRKPSLSSACSQLKNSGSLVPGQYNHGLRVLPPKRP